MYCPKCKSSLSDDSKFCTACGCRIEKEQPTAPVYQQPPVPQYSSPQYYPPVSGYNPAPAPQNKSGMNKTSVVFLVLFIAALIGCFALLAYSFGLKNENDSYEREISGYLGEIEVLERSEEKYKKEADYLKEELKKITAERDELSGEVDFAIDLFQYIASNDSWGYATENFHADKGIIFLDRFGGTQSLGIYSTYYTTFYFEISDTTVVDGEWSDKNWTEKGTEVFLTPLDTGYCTITFTNDLYDTSFEVLVIVI